MKREIDTPIKRFNRYGMWKHFFDCKEIEVRLSLIFTTIIIFLLFFLGCYEKLDLFREPLQNITINIAVAFIGVLGFILSGVAMITAMLSTEVCKKIEDINGEDSLKQILYSFEFIAFNVSILIVLLFTVYLSLFSDLNFFNSISFYIICILLVYLVIFVIFYLFALIGNCIQMFYITNRYQVVIKQEEKQFNELLNEIRIDFMLANMNKNQLINSQTFISELVAFIEHLNINDKDRIVEYFKKHYGITE